MLSMLVPIYQRKNRSEIGFSIGDSNHDDSDKKAAQKITSSPLLVSKYSGIFAHLDIMKHYEVKVCNYILRIRNMS